MQRSRYRWLIYALLLGLLGGCNSTPTLPLPPPVASVTGSTSQGLVLVEGDTNPRAFVSVFNEQTESGVITRADQVGHFVVEIEAATGDLLSIWVELDGVTGERKQITVPELE